MSNAGQGPQGRSPDLLLILELEPDVDPEVTERSARQLRSELKEVDVESIIPLTSSDLPQGAKGTDPVSLGSLLITLSATGGALTILLHTVRDWLARQAAAHRISVTIDDDTIVLEKASGQERSALIDAYIRRHKMNEMG